MPYVVANKKGGADVSNWIRRNMRNRAKTMSAEIYPMQPSTQANRHGVDIGEQWRFDSDGIVVSRRNLLGRVDVVNDIYSAHKRHRPVDYHSLAMQTPKTMATKSESSHFRAKDKHF